MRLKENLLGNVENAVYFFVLLCLFVGGQVYKLLRKTSKREFTILFELTNNAPKRIFIFRTLCAVNLRNLYFISI